ncbi:elongation factor P hydroxylase [Pseudomaricurvus alkylphenolicus]|uniref:elongation factor P hydroxylase n=1 Tax=Pseudomaricurvus alkylphenolicus TaxID=1306991 RepID=UPI0014218FF2|nr:elongation factor P hydroxylase [Pseudomaricurvus alkylphenolicus]NIB44408.1 elongation factor P hydroxylase [Pseudomaricurvus alkylphenolicus]
MGAFVESALLDGRVLGKGVELDHIALTEVFNALFETSHNTILVGGASEPLYRPSQAVGEQHCIEFTQDYAASALHEIAHWCVAGEKRRQQVDYGYWYAPDGRSSRQQAEFERVEVKPQALEWMFSVAAGRSFRVSADNLEAGLGASDGFKDAIHAQVQRYCLEGLPRRPRDYLQALSRRSGQSDPCNPELYRREWL